LADPSAPVRSVVVGIVDQMTVDDGILVAESSAS
jgi:hypothetical protein